MDNLGGMSGIGRRGPARYGPGGRFARWGGFFLALDLALRVVVASAADAAPSEPGPNVPAPNAPAASASRANEQPGAGSNLKPQTSGLTPSPAAGRLRDKLKEKPKGDFDRLQLRLKLSDRRDALHTFKPGHWIALTYATSANNFDFSGELGLTPCQQNDDPLALTGAPYFVTVERPAALPKGQKKIFEAPLFVCPSPHHPWVGVRLSNAENQAVVKRERDELQPMPPNQFLLIVLARSPESYGYLHGLPSLRLFDDAAGAPGPALYRIVAPVVGVHSPLPTSALFWTSVAYLVWDDLASDVLDADQRQALVDWLHWGGQLIVSGPRTLELLRGSFLTPYLPATGDETQAVDPARLAELDRFWSPAQKSVDRQTLAGERAWPGVRLKLTPGATFLPATDELAAERRVGRGRIVVTGFSLSQPGIRKWRGFDGLLNACLLRRAPRKFTGRDPMNRPVVWLDDDRDYEHGPHLTSLRFFVRDDAHEEQPETAEEAPDAANSANGVPGWVTSNYRDPAQVEPVGVAGWDDAASVPNAARSSLRRGAGIAVPSPRFVFWFVTLYLLVLVPANWTLFRLVGRVEWAWAAAPVISLGCGALVIWLAQLDIGFSRGVTELAIVETQGAYPRAHLTRFMALYASLSTSYDLTFDEPTAVALPFATSTEYSPLIGESLREVRFSLIPRPRLAGLDVASNSTSMARSECFFDLGGGFDWDEDAGAAQLTNGTSLSLAGAAIVRRAPVGEQGLWAAWIGDLPAGAVVRPAFRRVQLTAEATDPWSDHRPQATPRDEQALDLEGLVRLAESTRSVALGETRLVGWRLEELPGVSIEPAVTHRRRATLVVAHLARETAPPSPDQWEEGAKDPFDARRWLELDMPAQIPDPEPPAK